MIRTMPSKGTHLLCVSEAGPCGSWLSRSLTTKGYAGWVVAPSLMPQKPGDRVTTARRAAGHLARLARSGDRTAVSGPTGDAAAMRDLPRARAEALSERKDATCRLTAFVLRHAIRYVGRANWGPAHLRWLAEVGCPPAAQPIVFHADVRAVNAPSARLQRLAQARQDPVPRWRLHPVVEALQALRGVPCTVAVTLVAARGALTRCERPRELRTCMGLTPAAYASGAHRRQGALTKAGTTPARRVWVEGAWAYRSPAKGSRPWPLRREKPPKRIQDISGKAPGRLCTRSRRLVARGKHATVVPVAIARELTGCMGAIAKEGPVTP